MYKSCSRCGKIHDINYKCNVGKVYKGGEERQLRSRYAWALKSKEIKERSNYLCEVCKQEGIYTYENLEVHHITKVSENKDRLLDNTNLICLCQKHHKLADKNIIPKDYLEELAMIRENNE